MSDFNQSHYSAILTNIIKVGVGVATFAIIGYLNSINTSIHKLTEGLIEVSTASQMIALKIDHIDVNQTQQDNDLKAIKAHVIIIDKEVNQIDTLVKLHETQLKEIKTSQTKPY